MATREALADLDVWAVKIGSAQYGNGAGPRYMIGSAAWVAGTGPSRVFLRVPLTDLLAGITKPIESANLQLHVLSAGGCFSQGSAPKMWVEELTAAWGNTNSHAVACSVTSTNSPSFDVGSTQAHRRKWEGTPASGTWITVNLTEMVEAARIANKTHLLLRLVAADTGTGYAESTTGRRISFATADSSNKPKLEISWVDNVPPNAPVDPTPKTQQSGDPAITTPGTNVWLEGTFSDPDVGDKPMSVETQIFAGTVTQQQANAGSVQPLQKKTTAFTANQVPGLVMPAGETLYRFREQHTGLTGNALYAWRSATRDSKGDWGPYGELQWFRTNTVPGQVSNFGVETDTLTPDLTGVLVDADPGAKIGAVWLTVLRDNPGGTATAMLPRTRFAGVGVTGGTAFVIKYNGAALAYGTDYRANVEIEDEYGGIGPPRGTWLIWRPVQVAGPSAMTPRSTATKQNTRTPSLTIGHSLAFDQHELEVAPNADGTGMLLWAVGPTANGSTLSLVKNWTAAVAGATAQPAAWGQIVYWRSKVRATATQNWTEWSPWFAIYVNALPETPSLEIESPQGVRSTLSTLSAAAGSLNPKLLADLRDPDRDAYGEIAVRRHLEIRKSVDDSLLLSVNRPVELDSAPSVYEVDPRRLLRFESLTGWTATSCVISKTAAAPAIGTALAGIGSLRFAVSGLAAGAVAVGQGPTLFVGVLSDLSHAGVTQMRVRVRASSLSNLSHVRLRFQFNTPGTDWAEFTITPAVVNTWELKTLTKGSPTATGGAVDWSKLKRVDVRVTAVSGAHTGNVDLADLHVEPLFVYAGERLAAFDSVDEVSAGGAAAVEVDPVDRQQGAGSLKVTVAGADGVQLIARRGVQMDLSSFRETELIRVWIKASTLTAMNTLRLRLSQSATGEGVAATYREYNVKPGVAGVWQEFVIARNAHVAGTMPNGGFYDIRSISLVLAPTGTFSGVVHVDDVRMGTIGEQMLVRLRYMDANTEDAWGPWTNGGEYGRLKLGVPPTVDFVGQQAPDAANARPAISYRFGSPKPQARRRLLVYRVIGTDRRQAYDTTLQETAVEGVRIPGGVLVDGATYEALVYAEDADRLGGSATTDQWVTSFVVPAAVTGLTAEIDASETLAYLSWNAVALDDFHFEEYRVYRQSGQSPPVLVGTVKQRGSPTFVDEDAWGFGVFSYSVTVSNGAYESAPTTVELSMPVTGWYLRVPGEFTVPLRYARPGATARREARTGERQPLGRDTPIVHTGRTLKPRGSFVVKLSTTRFGDVDRIREAAKRSRELPYVILKTGLGESMRVRIETVGEQFGSAGQAELTVPYISVA